MIEDFLILITQLKILVGVALYTSGRAGQGISVLFVDQGDLQRVSYTM